MSKVPLMHASGRQINKDLFVNESGYTTKSSKLQLIHLFLRCMIRLFNIDSHLVIWVSFLGQSFTENLAWLCKLTVHQKELLHLNQRNCCTQIFSLFTWHNVILLIQKAFILEMPPLSERFEQLGSQESIFLLDGNLPFFFLRTTLHCMFALPSSLLMNFGMTSSLSILVGLRWHILISSRLRATRASLATWMTGIPCPKGPDFVASLRWSIASALNQYHSRWSWADRSVFCTFSRFPIRFPTYGRNGIYVGNASHWTLLDLSCSLCLQLSDYLPSPSIYLSAYLSIYLSTFLFLYSNI